MAVLGLWALSCGRSQPLTYACFPFDETRECHNTCGTGTQRCVLGAWGSCDATGDRPCEAACGLKAERCEDGLWQGCDGHAERACAASCFTTLEQCVNGVWSGCQTRAERPCAAACNTVNEVCLNGVWHGCAPTAARPCQNACGAGTEQCSNGQWGRCDARSTRPCESMCGTGVETCSDGAFGTCSAPLPQSPPPTVQFTGIVRDFHRTHPDFERTQVGDEHGLVEPVLGPDGEPVYALPTGTRTVTSPETFAQWFHDVPGVNLSTSLSLTLTRTSLTPLLYSFDAPEYFPIDNQLFGNEGLSHDYHFCLEAHGSLQYLGGEQLTFRGDDDIWVFVNRTLAIDLGGTHVAEEGVLRLDTLALTKGDFYPLDLFFCERHTVDSSLRIDASGARFNLCP